MRRAFRRNPSTSILESQQKRKYAGLRRSKKLLIAISAVLLICYFATAVFINYNDAQYGANVLNDETLYEDAFKSSNSNHNLQKDTAETKGTGINVNVNGSTHIRTKTNDDPLAGNQSDGMKERSTIIASKKEASYELKAFIEPINQDDWNIKPLPVRNTTASSLTEKTYDRIACSTLPQQWPTSEETAPTNKDPFLPWIHDVFPSADGNYIQFVAQNKRRCQSGILMGAIKKFMQPNVALFQHVPVTRVLLDGKDEIETETRYRISSHEEADPDGIETRFICRFKPSMEETLSVHNLNYDYHTLRKAYKATFTKEGFDNHMIWSSQLLFKCPVPKSLQEQVRLGSTVVNDFATQFIDLIPIRTSPRYGPPVEYLPPRLYNEDYTWDPKKEWGDNHLLPRIQDSGRWENIPICKPSLMTYPDEGPIDQDDKAAIKVHDTTVAELAQNNNKKKLIACAWTSSSFQTRGGKTTVNDGDQRLLQWLEFNKMVGVDHVYIYDNSGAFSKTNSLKPVTDLFPGFATRINWPAKVCNNRPGNGDNKGERSSQYAAAMSCHLRFGAHSDWLMAADTDEYMAPMGNFSDLKELLNSVEKQEINVLNWKSKRSKPRLQFFNTTPSEQCNKCFNPSLPEGKTFLEVYNCNFEKPPRKNVMPAEKAIYRTDFVVLFFVHYATATVRSQMGKPEIEKNGERWNRRYKVRPGSRYADEEVEGTMLHTKAIVSKEITYWNKTMLKTPQGSKLGVEWPEGTDEVQNPALKTTIFGTQYSPNCYSVPKIDSYWVPHLVDALEKRGLPKY